jgi:hypothetical protein
MAAEFALIARVALVVVFGLAATWKLANRDAFAQAFRGMAPRGLRSWHARAVWPVGACEFLIALAILAGSYSRALDVIGCAGALAGLLAFSWIIVRAKEIGSCGCWAMPFASDGLHARRLLLQRNSILIGIATAALALPSAIPDAWPEAAVAGCLVGLITIELPQISSVAGFYHREPKVAS